MAQDKDNAPFYRRTSFWTKFGITVAVLFAIYLLIGYFLFPWILKGQLEDRLTDATGRQTTIESVRANPLLFKLAIEDFRMEGAEKSGDDVEDGGSSSDLLRFERLFVDLSLSSVRHLAPVIDVLQLRGPSISVARNADGELSFEDVVRRLAERAEDEEPQEESDEPPKFRIDELQIINGAIHIEDAAVSPRFTHTTEPINLTLVDLGTLTESDSEGSMAAETAQGARFSWEGSVSLQPLGSTGRVVLENLGIDAFQPYLDRLTKVEVGSSQVSLEIPYVFNAAPDQELFEIHNGQALFRTLQARVPAADEPFFELEQLEVNNIEFLLTARDVSVESINLRNGRLLAERDADGEFPLLDLVPEGSGERSEDSEPSEDEWSYGVQTVNAENFEIAYVDASFSEPLEYPVTIDTLTAEDISQALDQPVSVSLQLTLANEGTFTTEGNVVPQPLSADLDLALDSLPLGPLGAIAGSMSKISTVQGSARAEGRLEMRTDEGSDEAMPLITYSGSAGLRDFMLAESPESEPLLEMPTLDFNELSAGTQPLRMSAEMLQLEAPVVVVIRSEGGELNWLTLVQDTTPEGAEEAPPEPADDGAALEISIAEIQIQEGQVTFEDYAVDPVVEQQIQPLNLTVNDFSLDGQASTELRIQATIQNAAQLEGSARWLAGDLASNTDLSFRLTNYSVPPLSPYATKFIGRRLASGDLALDLQYTVDQAQLEGSQSITLAQFELGSDVPQEGAINLPIGLAVSLLKDRNGTISLDVPLSGDLNDPEFNFAGVIRNAFMNVIERAATAPFRLLGSVFGSGEEELDLSFVAFAAGSTDPDEQGREKLDTLAEALYERPQLSLAYFGRIDPEADREAIARNRLREQLREFAGDATFEGDGPDLDDPEVYEQLVTEAYRAEQATTSEPEARQESTTAEVESSPNESTSSATTRMRGPGRPGSPGARIFTSPSSRSPTESQGESTSATETAQTEAQVEPSEPDEEPSLSVEEMEAALLEDVAVTEEDLEALRRQREETVRTHLLNARQLESDRLQAVDPFERDDSGEAEAPGAVVIFDVR